MTETLARSQLYVLDERRNPVRADNLHDWAMHMEKPHRVAQTMVKGIRISTVFIGLAGNLMNLPRPFETVMFHDGDVLPESQRYATWEAAERGHAAWVKQVQSRREAFAA